MTLAATERTVTKRTTQARSRDEADDIIDRFCAQVKAEFPDADKESLARLAATLRHEHGGTTPYVRSTSLDAKAQQLDQFRSIFNGRNAAECARVLGVSRSTVFRWIKTQGKV